MNEREPIALQSALRPSWRNHPVNLFYEPALRGSRARMPVKRRGGQIRAAAAPLEEAAGGRHPSPRFRVQPRRHHHGRRDAIRDRTASAPAAAPRRKRRKPFGPSARQSSRPPDRGAAAPQTDHAAAEKLPQRQPRAAPEHDIDRHHAAASGRGATDMVARWEETTTFITWSCRGSSRRQSAASSSPSGLRNSRSVLT